MPGKIKTERADWPVQFRIINLITLYTAVISTFVLPLFIWVKASWSLVIVVGIFAAAAFALNIAARFMTDYKLFYYVYAFVINIILLPMLYIYSGGLYSGMPMLFIAGYIVIFLLLDGISLVVSVIIISIWYCYVMAYSYYNPDMLSHIQNDKALLADIGVCFLCTAVTATTVLWIHTGVYKRLNKSLQQSRNMVEETAKVRSRFLASMSGELRTPMNAILNMAEMLEREGNTDIIYERYMIQESAFSLLDTINNVINYSNLDLGRLSLSPRQFSLKKFFSDVIYTFGLEIQNKGLRFETSINPAIPMQVYGDISRIHEVFQYVLYNAVKSTDDGRISMDIDYTQRPENKAVTIRVKITDTGMGLSEEEKNSIFSSFEIYDSKKFSQLKKVGLELTICRDILWLMNGDMIIDSIEGVGTEIEFWFDVYAVEDTPLVDTALKTGKRALVLVEKNTRSAHWVKLFHQFGIMTELVYTAMAFETMIKERGFELYLLSDYSYRAVENIINKYSIQNRCYVLTDYEHTYMDFGKCRILRRPVNSLNLAEAVADTWNEEDYIDNAAIREFTAPRARVLIVDDQLINLKVISGLLSQYGMLPSVASTAAEAISKCECEEYDIIFADREMPVTSGLELLHNIRRLNNNANALVPVIALASSLGTVVKEEYFKEGFNGCLAKPVKFRELDEILRQYLPESLLEAAKHEEKAEKTFEAIPAGLLAEKGLERCGGDERMYCSILATFYKEGAPKIEQILSQHESGDIAGFTINVHAVKSAAASIGGLRTSEAYKELEAAGKAEDTKYINDNLQPAIVLYRELLEDVEKYLRSRDAFEEKSAADVSEAELEEIDIQDLELFIQYADEFETELLEELSARLSGRNFGDKVNPYIADMLTAVEEFDYDIALDKAKELLEVLGA